VLALKMCCCCVVLKLELCWSSLVVAAFRLMHATFPHSAVLPRSSP
jgi:hypothetical protein